MNHIHETIISPNGIEQCTTCICGCYVLYECPLCYCIINFKGQKHNCPDENGFEDEGIEEDDAETFNNILNKKVYIQQN